MAALAWAGTGPSTARAQVIATWLNASGGTWTLPANWSSSPFYPSNDNPPGTTYDAVIALPGSYTVSLGSATVDNVTLDSSSVTLSQSGTLTAQSININSGTYLLRAGAISHATLNIGAAGTFDMSGLSARFDHLTLGAGQLPMTQESVCTGLTINAGATFLVKQRFHFGTNSGPTTFETIAGTGSLVLDHGFLLTDAATLSVGAGMTVGVAPGSTGEIDGPGMVNHGLIVADGGVISINGGGAPISDPLTNQGILRATNGGQLKLGGTVTLAGLGQHEATNGGKIVIGNVFDNTGGTLVLDGPQQSLCLSGRLNGGTIQTSNAATLEVSAGTSYPYLSGVFVDADLFVNDASDFGLYNGAVIAPGRKIHVIGGSNNLIRFDPSLTTQILLENSSSCRIGDIGSNTTFSTGMEIRASGGDASIGSEGPTFTTENHGLISAESAGHSINIFGTGNSFNNHGTMQVSAGTLACSAKLVNSGPIAISGGTFDLAGQWDNPTGSITLSGGTFRLGGNVNLAMVGSFTRTGGSVLLTGTFNNATTTADLTTAVGAWNPAGSARIIGGSIVPSVPGQALRLDSGSLTIDGASLDSDLTIAPGTSLTLQGAWALHHPVTGNGASLSLGGTFATADLQNVSISGSTITLTGTVNNTGATFPPALGSGNAVVISGGTINGGTVGAPGQTISVNGNRGTFGGVTLAGTLTGTDRVILTGGMTLSSGASLRLTGGPGTIQFMGTQSVGGSGEIVFDSGTNTTQCIRAVGTGAVLTLGPGVEIRTGLRGGIIGATDSTIVSQGTISSQTAARGISIVGGFDNQGVVQALNGGTILLPLSFANFSSGVLTGGSWAVYANSTISLGAINTNNASILLDGVASNFAAVNLLRTNLGTFRIDHGRKFTSVGSLSNSGAIGIGSAGSAMKVLDTLSNTGTVDLNGALIVDYTGASPLSALVGQIGTHIISSDAVSDPRKRIGYAEASALAVTTFAGLSVDSTSALLKLTWAGDSDLDGDADGVDIGRWATNFTGELGGGASATMSWSQGDWDYDGDIDGVDAGLWAQAFTGELGGAGLSSVVVNDASLSPEALNVLEALGVTVVPEPAVGGLLVMTVLGMTRRQRRTLFGRSRVR